MPTLPMTGSERPQIRETANSHVEESGELVDIAQDEEEDHDMDLGEEEDYFALGRRRTLRASDLDTDTGASGTDMETQTEGRNSMDSIDEDGSGSYSTSSAASPSTTQFRTPEERPLGPEQVPASAPATQTSFTGSSSSSHRTATAAAAATTNTNTTKASGGGGYFSFSPRKYTSDLNLRTPRPGDYISVGNANNATNGDVKGKAVDRERVTNGFEDEGKLCVSSGLRIIVYMHSSLLSHCHNH